MSKCMLSEALLSPPALPLAPDPHFTPLLPTCSSPLALTLGPPCCCCVQVRFMGCKGLLVPWGTDLIPPGIIQVRKGGGALQATAVSSSASHSMEP